MLLKYLNQVKYKPPVKTKYEDEIEEFYKNAFKVLKSS